MFAWLKINWYSWKLRSADLETRIVAVRALERMADRRAVTPLLEALSDDSPLVRVAVAKTLGELTAVVAIPGLVNRLLDQEESVREAAVTALARINDRAAIPLLLAYLPNPIAYKVTRLQAIKLLVDFKATESLPSLLDLLVENDSEVNDRARAALNAIAPSWKSSPEVREAIPRFVRQLATNERIRAVLLELNAIPHLLRLLPDSQESVNRQLLKLVDDLDQKWRESGDTKLLAARCGDALQGSDNGLRLQAIQIVETLRDTTAIPLLIKHSIDINHNVARAALTALDAIDSNWRTRPVVASHLRGFVYALTTEARQQAVDVLSRIRAPETVPNIFRALESEKERSSLHVSLLQDLDQIEPEWRVSPAARAALVHHFDNPPQEFTQAPVWVKYVIESLGESHLSLLLNAVDRAYRSKDVELWYAVTRRLGQIAPDAAIELANALRSNSNKEVIREAAAVALRHGAPPEGDRTVATVVREALVSALRDRDRFIGIAAADALGTWWDESCCRALLAIVRETKDARLLEIAIGVFHHTVGAKAQEVLVLLLRTKEPVVQRAAALALADWPEGIAALYQEAAKQAKETRRVGFLMHCWYRAQGGEATQVSGPMTVEAMDLRSSHRTWQQKIAKLKVDDVATDIHDMLKRGTDINQVATLTARKMDLLDGGVDLDNFLRCCCRRFTRQQLEMVAGIWGIGGFWR